jgi:hypothetical protein
MQEILVPYVSAIQLANNENYMIEDANHFTVCKPSTKVDMSYSKLLEILKLCLKVSICYNLEMS